MAILRACTNVTLWIGYNLDTHCVGKWVNDSGHSLKYAHCASSAIVFMGVMKRLKTCIILCLYDHTDSPDHSRSDFSTKENAECADCVRGEHANDGEGHRELPVQTVS